MASRRPRLSESATCRGWYGKLASLGDFAQRRLPPEWLRACDAWLAVALRARREQLGERWLEVYLTAPVLRFAWAPGVVDSAVVVRPADAQLRQRGPLLPAAWSPSRARAAAAGPHRAGPPRDAGTSTSAQAAVQTLNDDDGSVDALEAALQEAPPVAHGRARPRDRLAEAPRMGEHPRLGRAAPLSQWLHCAGGARTRRRGWRAARCGGASHRRRRRHRRHRAGPAGRRGASRALLSGASTPAALEAASASGGAAVSPRRALADPRRDRAEVVLARRGPRLDALLHRVSHSSGVAASARLRSDGGLVQRAPPAVAAQQEGVAGSSGTACATVCGSTLVVDAQRGDQLVLVADAPAPARGVMRPASTMRWTTLSSEVSCRSTPRRTRYSRESPTCVQSAPPLAPSIHSTTTVECMLGDAASPDCCAASTCRWRGDHRARERTGVERGAGAAAPGRS